MTEVTTKILIQNKDKNTGFKLKLPSDHPQKEKEKEKPVVNSETTDEMSERMKAWKDYYENGGGYY